ncbi:MAG: FkbM family methyltransferase [Pseudorhodoplanes sp.]|nr:FkbM family methyltransferase [Pseudorhodoplanes sp.]
MVRQRMPALFPPEREPSLVREFLSAEAPGYFVEVGANDPVKESQSWHLEQLGWAGVLIEPLPELAARLRETRKASVFEVACSSPQRAGSVMTLHIAGAYSSFDPRLSVTGVRPERTIQVPVRTLNDVLEEAGAPSPIDLLSIDVEGHELEVLKGFDLARWQPRLILLEDHVTNLAKHHYMLRAGYRLMRRTGLNSWYVPRHAKPRLDALARWQLIRKYYIALPFRQVRDAKRRVRDRIRDARDKRRLH